MKLRVLAPLKNFFTVFCTEVEFADGRTYVVFTTLLTSAYRSGASDDLSDDPFFETIVRDAKGEFLWDWAVQTKLLAEAVVHHQTTLAQLAYVSATGVWDHVVTDEETEVMLDWVKENHPALFAE